MWIFSSSPLSLLALFDYIFAMLWESCVINRRLCVMCLNMILYTVWLHTIQYCIGVHGALCCGLEMCAPSVLKGVYKFSSAFCQLNRATVYTSMNQKNNVFKRLCCWFCRIFQFWKAFFMHFFIRLCWIEFPIIHLWE